VGILSGASLSGAPFFVSLRKKVMPNRILKAKSRNNKKKALGKISMKKDIKSGKTSSSRSKGSNSKYKSTYSTAQKK